MFDRRGTGLSDRIVDGAGWSIEERIDDVRAVMDAAGSEHAAIYGVADGGPVAIAFAATYPDRTTALILGPTVRSRGWAPDYPGGLRDEDVDRYIARDRA